MTQKELKKRKWCIIDGAMVEEIEKIHSIDGVVMRVDLKDQSYKSNILVFEWYTFETELDALETLRDNMTDQLDDINKRIAELEEMDND